jgi:hypothetical protein
MPPETAGWQQRAGKPQLQIPFSELSPDSFFLSPYLWWENNWTTPACWKTYWNCIAFELGTLGGLFLCSFVLLYVSPLMRQLQNKSEATSPGLQAEGRIPKLLRLKFHPIWTWRFLFCFILFLLYTYSFFFHLLIFYFCSYLYSFYFLLSILSLSL